MKENIVKENAISLRRISRKLHINPSKHANQISTNRVIIMWILNNNNNENFIN